MRQCDAIIVHHCKSRQFGKVEWERDWDLTDAIVSNIDDFKVTKLFATQLPDISELVHVKMQLFKTG